MLVPVSYGYQAGVLSLIFQVFGMWCSQQEAIMPGKHGSRTVLLNLSLRRKTRKSSHVAAGGPFILLVICFSFQESKSPFLTGIPKSLTAEAVNKNVELHFTRIPDGIYSQPLSG